MHNSQKNNTYGEGGDGSGGSAEGSEEESTGSKYGQGDEENDEVTSVEDSENVLEGKGCIFQYYRSSVILYMVIGLFPG